MLSMLTRIYNMPKPMKAILVIGLLGGLGYFTFQSYGLQGVVLLVFGVVAVALILAFYAFLIKLIKRRRAARFAREMAGQSGATPTSISEAEAIAKLDDLLKKFEEGVGKFKVAGKDLYSLPWYLVVGESGAGKTEAIRRSSIGFPPGLQDELQGVGGTINMNWWFANQAVLLDLAGRLMFEEVDAGVSSEWKEFLGLLRMYRPNCPINGMILVIPADSLIKDTPEEIERKGAKIVQQLDVVQRTLDIRFPVFVAVSKCDLINGFREFFDDLTSPQQQYQIVGWSNPLPIDEPFQPESVDQHLSQVIERLNQKRYVLLQDPEPLHDLSARRADEVDTLYDFPHSFSRIVPALKRYLQLLFVSSEWSAKPLFLRGIYFTSSMREGVALDAELADAMGVLPESLPEGRVFERDRAYFLRDVFINRIFPERGLVTRATNVRRQQMQRRAALLGAGMAGVAMLLAFTWLGGRGFKKTIGAEQDLWRLAAKAVETDARRVDKRLPIVAQGNAPNPGNYVYRGDLNFAQLDGDITLSGFHHRMQDLAENPLRIPWIFRLFQPFDQSLNHSRRDARRILFELSILEPVVRATRYRMSADPGQVWSPTATAALEQLIRIEATAMGLDYDTIDPIPTRINLNALFRYVLTQGRHYEKYDMEDGPAFDKAFEWVYKKKGGRGKWVPVWLPRGQRLAEDIAIRAGVDRFINQCTDSVETADLVEHLYRVENLEPRLATFSEATITQYLGAEDDFKLFVEANLLELDTLRGFEDIESDWVEEYEILDEAMNDVLHAYKEITNEVSQIPLFQQQNADVITTYANAATNALLQGDQCMQALRLPGREEGKIRSFINWVLPFDEQPTLISDMKERMAEAVGQVNERFEQPAITNNLSKFEGEFTNVEVKVTSSLNRYPAYIPVTIPEPLKYHKFPWKQFPDRLGKKKVPFVHEDLENLLREIDAMFARIEERGVLPAEKIAPFNERFKLSLERIESRNFKRECVKVLENWSRLTGNSMSDRATLLAMSGKDFINDYLIMASETEDDYVAKYWKDLVLTAMESLADAAISKAQEMMPELKQYERFPLNLPGKRNQGLMPGLSPHEVADAFKVLRKVHPSVIVDDPKTVGDGINTEMYLIDEQLQRLRDLGLKEKGEWIRSALRMLVSVPTEPPRKLACKVWLLPVSEQERLLAKFGMGQVREDSVLPVWTYMELSEGEGLRIKKFKTLQSEPVQIGRIMYPGDRFEFRFFKYFSDVQPQQSYSLDGPWACLRLLHVLQAGRHEEEINKWEIQVPLIDASGHKRFLWLQLEFEQAVPSIAEWPNAQSS